MQPNPNLSRVDVDVAAERCVSALDLWGLSPATATAWEVLCSDVQHYMTHGSWSPLQRMLSVRQRVRLAVIAGVLEGAPMLGPLDQPLGHGSNRLAGEGDPAPDPGVDEMPGPVAANPVADMSAADAVEWLARDLPVTNPEEARTQLEAAAKDVRKTVAKAAERRLKQLLG